jgi:hypothetical protein
VKKRHREQYQRNHRSNPSHGLQLDSGRSNKTQYSSRGVCLRDADAGIGTATLLFGKRIEDFSASQSVVARLDAAADGDACDLDDAGYKDSAPTEQLLQGHRTSLPACLLPLDRQGWAVSLFGRSHLRRVLR